MGVVPWERMGDANLVDCGLSLRRVRSRVNPEATASKAVEGRAFRVRWPGGIFVMTILMTNPANARLHQQRLGALSGGKSASVGGGG
jgi:hypothetical protein